MEKGRAKKKCNHLGMEKGGAKKKEEKTPPSNPSTLIVHVNAYGGKKSEPTRCDGTVRDRSKFKAVRVCKEVVRDCTETVSDCTEAVRANTEAPPGVIEAVRDCSAETIRACTASLQIA